MHATAVPEPSTLVFLFAAWLAVSIVLLCKPGRRAAGIVVLAAPLALIVVAGVVWWWWAGTATPALPPPHRPTQSVTIDPDQASNPDDNVVVSRSNSIEDSEPAVGGGAAPTSMRADAILFVLFAVLLLGGLAATVALLAFPKTRTAGAVILAIGVPAVVLLLGLVWFLIPLSDVAPREWRPATEVRLPNGHSVSVQPIRSQSAGEARSRLGEPQIPVDVAERAVAKSTKPAAKPGNGAVAATSGATTASDKKPAVANADSSPTLAPAAVPAKKSPAWIDEPSRLLGDTYQTTLVIGPYTTREECNAELPGELQKALNRYVETCMGQPAGWRPVALPYEFLRQEVVKGEYAEIRPSSVGPMTRLYLLLQFDRKIRDRIVAEGRRNTVAGRLWVGGSCLAGMLWLLAVIYGYLRVDLKTGGAYRGRLRFAAVLAILGPVAAALLVVA